ncbi:hypothetical protein OPT61_g10755 [Boeremia exigua]|uniref:Uncharacterized protein n=1 Tax=Boeremia exigua TaxID=749465 RepID=A0ACC2HN28_9PLEO|nr:hypothetical protein OPT61_g10755 [Boeremia exigua]
MINTQDAALKKLEEALAANNLAIEVACQMLGTPNSENTSNATSTTKHQSDSKAHDNALTQPSTEAFNRQGVQDTVPTHDSRFGPIVTLPNPPPDPQTVELERVVCSYLGAAPNFITSESTVWMNSGLVSVGRLVLFERLQIVSLGVLRST